MCAERKRAVASLVALALGIAALGCGGGDEPDANRRLTIEVRDVSADEVTLEAPDRVDAGVVEIELRNRGDMLHDAQLFRIDGGHTPRELVGELIEAVDSAPQPRWVHLAGGVAPVAPGQGLAVTQELEPGSYMVADTQEREKGPGGKLTNAAKGAIARFEVEGEASGELPDTRGRIVARDDGFVASGIRAGRNRITFVNQGTEPHHAILHPVPPGKTYQRAAQDLYNRESSNGWPPIGVPATRATTVIEPGERLVTELFLERGRYLIVCYLSDRAGGVSHLATTISPLRVR